MKTNNGRGSSRAWSIATMAGWLAGALWLVTPFNELWKMGNGNLGHNVLLSFASALLGIAMAVPLTHWLRRRLRGSEGARSRWLGGAIAIGHVGTIAAAIGVLARQWSFAVFLTALGIFFAMALFVFAAGTACRRHSFTRSFKRWMRRSWSFNGVFWIVIFLLLAAGDLYALWGIQGLNTIEHWSAVLERLVNQAMITLGLMLLFHGIRALTPNCFRPVLLVLASLLPFVIVADFAMRQVWNQSLLTVVNLFTSTGAFDFNKEMAAAGLNWKIGQVALTGVGLVAVALLLFYVFARLSRSAGFRTANRHVARVLAVCWLVAVAEGALSFATKRTESWQKHYEAFGVHLGLFAPPQGLEDIAIAFTEPLPNPQREDLLARLQPGPELRTPDVYVFMVESWRSDSISPEVTPFLSRFMAEEAQPYQRTYAASNCTPLSWFSFFHSRVAVHWADALKAENEAGGPVGAYPLRVLDKLGYDLHVRAVCDLGYKSLGPLNFGAENALADHKIDYPPGVSLGIPKREIEVLADLKEHLDADPKAPQFHFTALDSPHYNYYWPHGFDVLHEDCAANLPTNLRPSQQTVAGVVRRYHNAVHWVDYAIEEFVDYLKLRGRYENSVIIITGDHGEEFQEEGSWFHCSSLNGYQTEVPIMIKWPAWAEQQPPQTVVSHMDVMPSLLELIGLEETFYEGLSGRSLLRYSEQPREVVLSTVHKGESNIGLCFIGEERKAKFGFSGLWSTSVPDGLFVAGYSDLDDKAVDHRTFFTPDLSHRDYLRETFPVSTERFFSKFETE